MNGRVVKLHALTDPDRSRAEHDDLFAAADPRFVFVLIAGVKIRYIAVKLTGAGVYHLIHREYIVLGTKIVYFPFAHIPELGAGAVGKAHALCAPKLIGIKACVTQSLLLIGDIFDFVEKQHIYLRLVRYNSQIGVTADKLRYREYPVVSAADDILKQVGNVSAVKLFQVQVVRADLKRTHGLEKAVLDRSADGHDFTRRLHLRRQLV